MTPSPLDAPGPGHVPTAGRSRLFALSAMGIVVVLALVILSLAVLNKKDESSHHALPKDGIALANGQFLPLYGDGPSTAPAKDWTTKLDCNAECDLASDGDRIFSAEEKAGKHRIEAFDATTGKSVWKAPVNAGDYGVNVSMYGDLVLVTTQTDNSSRLTAYASADGTKEWSASGGWEGYAGDGKLLLTESNGGNDPVAVAVNTDDGKVAWRSAGQTLGVCGGKVLLSRQQQLAVVDEGSGKRSWTAPLSAGKQVTCNGDRVFALSGDGVTAFDIGSGDRQWRANVAGARAVAGIDQMVVVTGSSKAFAFETSSGKQLWSVAHNEKDPSLAFLLPVEGEKAMVFGDATEALIDLTDGTIGPEKPGPDGTGAAADSLVYLGEKDGQMHSLTFATLDEQWKAPVVKHAQRVVLAGGHVFVLANDTVTEYH